LRQLCDHSKDISITCRLPLEIEAQTGYSGALVAIKQVEDFLRQSFAEVFRVHNWEAISSLVAGRRRAAAIILGLLPEVPVEGRARIYAEQLLRMNPSLDRQRLANIAMTLPERREVLHNIGATLPRIDDVSIVWNAFECLQVALRDKENEELVRLEGQIERKQLEIEDATFAQPEQQTEEYPFSKELRRLGFAKVAEDAKNEFEARRHRAEFRRDWAKRKAEYDQNMRRERRKQPIMDNEAFRKALREGKEKSQKTKVRRKH